MLSFMSKLEQVTYLEAILCIDFNRLEVLDVFWLKEHVSSNALFLVTL